MIALKAFRQRNQSTEPFIKKDIVGQAKMFLKKISERTSYLSQKFIKGGFKTHCITGSPTEFLAYLDGYVTINSGKFYNMCILN